MKLRKTTLDRIAGAYAEAIAVGDYESAEGWLATAAFVADRQHDRVAHRSARRLATSSSTSAPNLVTERAAGSSPVRSTLNPARPSIA